MAGIAVGQALKVILMLGLRFPEITDRFEDFPDPARLVRTLTFSKSPKGLYLRLAAHENIVASKSAPTYSIGDAVTLVMHGPSILRDSGSGTRELLLTLEDTPEVTIEYRPRPDK